MTATSGMRNLTPHEIAVYAAPDDEAPVLVIPPSGVVARLGETVTGTGTVTVDGALLGVEHVEVGLDAVDVGDGPVVVSMLTALAVRGRDVYTPGPAVRDDTGRIVGCVGLRRVRRRPWWRRMFSGG